MFSTAVVLLPPKVDVNHDRLVTLDEFLRSTEKREFNNPRAWEVRTPPVPSPSDTTCWSVCVCLVGGWLA